MPISPFLCLLRCCARFGVDPRRLLCRYVCFDLGTQTCIGLLPGAAPAGVGYFDPRLPEYGDGCLFVFVVLSRAYFLHGCNEGCLLVFVAPSCVYHLPDCSVGRYLLGVAQDIFSKVLCSYGSPFGC